MEIYVCAKKRRVTSKFVLIFLVVSVGPRSVAFAATIRQDPMSMYRFPKRRDRRFHLHQVPSEHSQTDVLFLKYRRKSEKGQADCLNPTGTEPGVASLEIESAACSRGRSWARLMKTQQIPSLCNRIRHHGKIAPDKEVVVRRSSVK